VGLQRGDQQVNGAVVVALLEQDDGQVVARLGPFRPQLDQPPVVVCGAIQVLQLLQGHGGLEQGLGIVGRLLQQGLGLAGANRRVVDGGQQWRTEQQKQERQESVHRRGGRHGRRPEVYQSRPKAVS